MSGASGNYKYHPSQYVDMGQFNNPHDASKTLCPMCGQTFINGNKLNRHKCTCPAKDGKDA